MWVRKWERDQQLGVDSPVPTQALSNEEYIPRPQNKQQRQWEALIGEMAEEKSKRIGMPRRDFMRSSLGLATAFLASNQVFGNYWNVEAAETEEQAAIDEKHPEHEYFIFDVQTHFTDGFTFAFRNAEFLKTSVLSSKTMRTLTVSATSSKKSSLTVKPTWESSPGSREEKSSVTNRVKSWKVGPGEGGMCQAG